MRFSETAVSVELLLFDFCEFVVIIIILSLELHLNHTSDPRYVETAKFKSTIFAFASRHLLQPGARYYSSEIISPNERDITSLFQGGSQKHFFFRQIRGKR